MLSLKYLQKELVWLVCCHQRGLTVFSNNFPFSLYSHNVSLPASLEPFSKQETEQNSFTFALLLLAIAQNILPGIFSLKLNLLWISFLCVFLGKYLPFPPCWLWFDNPISAHVYIPCGLALLEDVTKQVWGGSEEVLFSLCSGIQ